MSGGRCRLGQRVGPRLIVALVPADTVLVMPAAARVKPLPLMLKSPAAEASLIVRDSPVKPAMLLFGAKAAAVPAKPTVVVEDRRLLTVLGTAFSFQLLATFQLLLVVPIQFSVAAAVLKGFQPEGAAPGWPLLRCLRRECLCPVSQEKRSASPW